MGLRLHGRGEVEPVDMIFAKADHIKLIIEGKKTPKVSIE